MAYIMYWENTDFTLASVPCNVYKVSFLLFAQESIFKKPVCMLWSGQFPVSLIFLCYAYLHVLCSLPT